MASVSDVMNKFAEWGFEEHRYPNAIGMWKNEQEGLAWLALNAPRNTDFVEVGSFMGGSTIIMALAKVLSEDAGYVHAFDVCFHPRYYTNISKVGRSIIQSNLIALDQRVNAYKVGLAFLDGWHSFRDVVREAHLIYPSLEVGGFLAFHDASKQPYIPKQLADARQYVRTHKQVMLETSDQDFRIDEAVVYLMDHYKMELVNIPMDETNRTDLIPEGWVRGGTSPYNSLVALRKN